MKLTFYGGTGNVTGANFFVEHKNEKGESLKFIVDCGMLQGVETADSFNHKDFPYDVATLDYLLVTHAHLDHVGRIPKLVKDGFKGKIISTMPTKDLAALILEDTLMLIQSKARRDGVLALFDKVDVEKSFTLWETIDYHQNFELGAGVSIYGKDSGHILGSTMYEVNDGKIKTVFTGDLGNSPSLLLNDTEVVEGDYLIMESVYGDRNHEPKDERRKKLKKIIADTINEKRCLVIPAFSLERTQMILYEMNEFFENNELPQLPVFLDSPLAIKITKVYEQYKSYFNEKVQEEFKAGDDVFSFPRLKSTPMTRDSERIDSTPNPKIIMAGSGMSSGGRIVQHEKDHAGDHNSTILLVGYQSLGTLGRQLEDGAPKVNIHGQVVEVKARIEKIEGYSSHKDSDHLVEFVEKANEIRKLKKVFTVMGEPKASLFLAQRLNNEVDVKTEAPEYGGTVDLV